MSNNEDFAEDSTMQELHQIREELERQQQESGLSILEWLEATEKDFRKSLAEDGFRMVKRGDRIFTYEIKPHSKTQKKPSALETLSHKSKTAKHKNYVEYLEDSTMRELHFIREKMEQEYRKSGLPSYDEWLQATEPDMHRSLAEVGFEIVTRDGRTFLDKIKPQSKKKPVKYKTVARRGKATSRKKPTS